MGDDKLLPMESDEETERVAKVTSRPCAGCGSSWEEAGGGWTYNAGDDREATWLCDPCDRKQPKVDVHVKDEGGA